MVRRGGRARSQKLGGMLAALDNGDQDAPQPMPLDSHLRRKENIHSNRLVSVKNAASPRKASEPNLGNELEFKQHKGRKFHPSKASPRKPLLQNKSTESPNRCEGSPLDILSPSAPLTSVKINLQNDSADGNGDYEPIRRGLLQSPLSIASAFSGNSSYHSTNLSGETENDIECAPSFHEEDSLESKATLSNHSIACGSHLSNDHSEDDREYSGNSESVDDDLDEDESINSQTSQSESGSEENDLDSSDNRYDESIVREYQEEDQTDEDFSVHLESESDDEFEFDAESSSSEDKKLLGKKKRQGQEKCKVNVAKSHGKLKRNASKSVRRTKKEDQSIDSDSTQSNVSEGTDDDPVRNPKKNTSKSEAGELVSSVGGDSDVEHKMRNCCGSATEEKSITCESAQHMNNAASYISTLQHTQIQCPKSLRKRSLKAASTAEPAQSEVLEIVDQLFKMIEDKDSVTVGDIVHSVAQHFGLSKVNKDTKKAIKARLTELIRAGEEDSVAEMRKEQRVMSRNQGTGEGMQHLRRSGGLGAKDDSYSVVDNDKCGMPCESSEPQQTGAFEIADSSKPPSDSEIICVVDRLFQAVEGDTVFLSDIVRAFAAHFGLEKVNKNTKQLIKARFVELIDATQNTIEEDVDQQFEETEAASADHSSIKSSFNEEIDASSSPVKKSTSSPAHEEPEAEDDSLGLSFDDGEHSFVVDSHTNENDNDLPKAVHSPIIGLKTPSSLMVSIDSGGHSLAGEYLKCNESFTSVETTLFKNLSPECVKANASDSMENLMGSLSISNSLSVTSEIRRVEKGKWSLGNEIGSGSFGVVHVGMNAVDGSLMAVKVLSIPSTNKRAIVDELQREIDLMRSLKHPNIVRYLGAEVDTSKNILNIFQEWVPGGSVSSLLKKFGPFSFAVIKSYATQILRGLEYLHSHHIIHRDIKGGNILVSNDGCVKLADFGASKRVEAFGIDPDKMMEELTVRGTPYFMAPEVFEEKYGPKADIWSVGGVIYQMATGSPPWKDLGHKNPISLFFHLKNTDDPPKIPSSIASRINRYDFPLLEEIISKCFQRDPSKRPNASTLLNDNFFSTNNVISSPTIQVVDNASCSPIAGTSSPTVTVQSHESLAATLSDSLCYSLTLPAPIHVGPGLKSDIDTSDWPDWAKKSYQQSCLHSERMKECNKSVQNPFSRSIGRK
eukprot:CCRYP_007376-RA/>CCRYP_007376-RA protein AED:0.03 eAED:0.03 QI:116/1/1/1/1/1/5/37/1180